MQSPTETEPAVTPTDVQPSTCWECGTLCGSLLTTEKGVVTKISPNPTHPASKGAFCVKGIRGAKEWTYQDGRLRTPLRRIGARGEGRFETVGWDEAIGEIADRLAEVRRRYGATAIAGATNGAFFSRGLMMALLMRSIGSPNWMINQDLCGGCRAVADKMTGLNVVGGEDIDATSCALIVGRNPSIADPIQWMALKRAKARGARIIVIDPFRTSAADIADLWLRPRPGTDGALALAMAHVLIAEELYDKSFVERRGPRRKAACRRRTSELQRRIMLKGRPVSFPGMASTGRASGCKHFVPFLRWWPSAAMLIASEATAAGKNRKASRPRLTCCSIRITGCHRRSRHCGSGQKTFRSGRVQWVSRWPVITLPSSRRCLLPSPIRCARSMPVAPTSY
jgi:anaerobic selenocysteine-containing dehydrogenase